MFFILIYVYSVESSDCSQLSFNFSYKENTLQYIFGGFFMRNLLLSIPVPLSGLMLGIMALAKIFFLIDIALIGNLLFAAGMILFSLIVLKAIFEFTNVRAQLENLAIASVSPTFTMGTMVMTSILLLQNAFVHIAHVIWVAAVVLHIVLMVYFVTKFIVRSPLTMQSVLPSWFVTFAGIGMIPVTAPAFAQEYTKWIVWLGLFNFIVLLPFILKRVFIMRDLPIPVKPMITILAAPASLTLLAYLTQYGTKNEAIIYTGIIVAQLLYFIVLYEVQTLIKMPFYPSFGAFTFPLVVSAMTLYMVTKQLKNEPLWFEPLFYFELIIASAITGYVFIIYMRYLAIQTVQTAEQLSSK